MKRCLRLGLPALAVYALVLQAFLGGAAPAAAFNPASALLCAEVSVGHDQPAAPAGQHHHGLCATHCGAPASTGLLGAAAAPAALTRVALLAQQAPTANERGATFSRHRGPGARAPPSS